MHTTSCFAQIIEDYKTHLRESTECHMSFSSFCSSYRVRPQSVRQWMWRHGLDVRSLYYEVLLEKYNSSEPGLILPCPAGHRKNIEKPTSDFPSDELIKGVCVTFPDGVVINIRQTSSSALTKFIDSYNKLNDKNHVQLK